MQSIYRPITLISSVAILFLSMSIESCKKMLDIPPPSDQIVDNNVYTNDETAIAVLTGIYTSMSSDGNFTGSRSISLLTGLSSDELTLHSSIVSPPFLAYYTNALSPYANTGSEFWGALYNYIFKCNAAEEGITASKSLTPAIKKQLLGEVKFLRAFFYFYVLNLFGDTPLAITTDYQINTLLPRASEAQVYQQIIKDLQEAQDLLSEHYLNENLQAYTDTEERLRPTKWAAVALSARVNLYIGNYSNAEALSTLVINNSSLYNLSPLPNAFTMNSLEAIWQLQPLIIGHNTEDAWTFIIPPTGPNESNPVYISPQLLNSFETGDQRKTGWIDSIDVAGTIYYYPSKYKSATLDAPLTEYLMILRIGEQFLIRAEARAQQNNIAGSISDLNVIRLRANLPSTNASDKASLLTAIQNERRVELFTEWGHRWLDLKRTNKVDAVMSTITPIKANGSAWKSYQQLYPIPLSDLQSAPNLVQNAGY